MRWGDVGTLIIDGLPLAAAEAVAWTGGAVLDRTASAAIAGRAVTVAPPWPAPVALEAVEP